MSGGDVVVSLSVLPIFFFYSTSKLVLSKYFDCDRMCKDKKRTIQSAARIGLNTIQPDQI